MIVEGRLGLLLKPDGRRIEEQAERIGRLEERLAVVELAMDQTHESAIPVEERRPWWRWWA